MSTALQADPQPQLDSPLEPALPIVADGKFLRAGTERFLVKGVTYGTFAPDAVGNQFPASAQIAEDFRLMAARHQHGPRLHAAARELLDEAARHDLRVMVGLPWSQHVAFLDDRALTRSIRREIVDAGAASSATIRRC